MQHEELGARIEEARLTAGQTQAQLAGAVSMDRTALAKIESGTRRVSALELRDLARELGRRVEWFLMPRLDAVVQHRKGGDGAFPTAIDVELEQFGDDVGLLVEIGTLQAPPPRPAQSPLRSVADAEALATRAREMGGVAGGTPVHDLVGLAQRLGVLTASMPLGESADAASLITPTWAVAVVNSTLDVGRRRLSLAHELGHVLMDDRYSIDERVGAETNTEIHEARIDRFARSLLLPAEALAAVWPERVAAVGVREAAVQIASHFRVDMSTLARRLKDLALADGAIQDGVRSVRTTRADIIEHDLVVPHDLADTTLPRVFERAVIRALSTEQISAERAVSLLRDTITAHDLPDLQPLPEPGMWSLID